MGQQQQQPVTFSADEIEFDASQIEGASAPPAGGRGFLTEATQGLNPVNINAAIQQAFWHPIDTVKATTQAAEKIRLEGQEAFKRGDYLTGTRKMLTWASSPLLLPMRLDEAADLMQQGDISSGLGATADVGLTMLSPRAAAAARARLPTRAGLAAAAERISQRQVVETIAPNVGPQKIRFGVQAAEVAPAIARRTTARTAGGLLDEVGENAARSYQALDQAYGGMTQPMPTRPILTALDDAINRLTVRGSGGAVQPQVRAERVAALQQARAEVAALGPNASPSQLRRLRIAWDEGAEAVFTPQMADNFRAIRQGGHGWADARTALNDALVQRHPELGQLNADARLWTTAREVMQAAEEVERVRPRPGRRIMAGAVGLLTGAGTGSPMAAASGAVIGPAVLHALEAAAPSVKLTTARHLASLADALKAGQRGRIRQTIGQIGALLPSAERATFTAQALRLLHDVDPGAPYLVPGAAAAPETKEP